MAKAKKRAKKATKKKSAKKKAKRSKKPSGKRKRTTTTTSSKVVREEVMLNPTEREQRFYNRMRKELKVSAQDAMESIQGLRDIQARGWDYTWRDSEDPETGDMWNEVLLLDEDGTAIAVGWDDTFSDIGQAHTAGILAYHERGRRDPPQPNAAAADTPPDREIRFTYNDPPEESGDNIRYGSWELGSQADGDQWYEVDYATGSDYSGGTVTESNYDVLTDMLEEHHPAGKKPAVWAETHGGHGTYGLLVVWDRLHRDVQRAIVGLHDYPLLDDEHHSNLELEKEEEAWENWARADFEREVEKLLDADDWPDDVDSSEVFELARRSANEYWEHTAEGPWINLNEIALEAVGHIEADPDWAGAFAVREDNPRRSNGLNRDARAAIGAAVGGGVGGGYYGGLGGAVGAAAGSLLGAHMAEAVGAVKGIGEGATKARRRELVAETKEDVKELKKETREIRRERAANPDPAAARRLTVGRRRK